MCNTRHFGGGCCVGVGVWFINAQVYLSRGAIARPWVRGTGGGYREQRLEILPWDNPHGVMKVLTKQRQIIDLGGPQDVSAEEGVLFVAEPRVGP